MPPMDDLDPRYRRRPSAAFQLLQAIFLGLLIAVAWRVFVPGGFSSLFDPDAKPRAVTPRGDLAADEMATIELFGADVISKFEE